MNEKFTPGPWKARMTYYGSESQGTPAVSHGDTSAFMCWLNLSGAYGGYKEIDRAKADASLIAAAPEIYATLQAVRDFWAGGDAPDALMAQIEAALAKAKGES